MNDKPETKIGYISPLKRICMTIGELPTSYLETMSYYEMLVWFVEFLKNQVIPVVNNNSEATEELQHLFIELQSYVNNYFDNLDVQEEINNKLDEMLEDGTLERLINENILLYAPRSNVEVDAIHTAYHGNMVLLKFKYMGEVKTAIFDFYDDPTKYISTEYDLLVNKMVEKGYTKFDYAIISHYHLDHVGCLPYFLEDSRLDFSETLFYLPPTPDYSLFTNPGYIPEKEQEIINLLNNKNITHITATNTTIEINEDTNLNFYNCDTDDFTDYYITLHNGNTIYNNFSLVCEIKHKQNIITLTGDIEQKAEEVVINQGIHKPTILQVQHHGLTGPVYSYLPFIQKFKGEINIIELPVDSNIQGIYNTYPLLYVTGHSGDIHVVSNGIGKQAFSEHGIVKGETTTTQRNLAENLVTDSYDLAPVSSSIYRIKANDDLNDYINYGTYECSGKDIADTLSNYPNYNRTAFKLYVNYITAFGRIRQSIIFANTIDPFISREYERYGLITEDSVTFGEWQVASYCDSGITLRNGTDLNDVGIGDYSSSSGIITATLTNVPNGVTTAFRMTCLRTSGFVDRFIQILIPQSTPVKMYIRYKSSDGWSAWYSFTGTIV